MDVVAPGGAGETKLRTQNLDEINLYFSIGNINIPEGVIGPSADVHTFLAEGLAIHVDAFVAADPDRLPDLELRPHLFILILGHDADLRPRNPTF